jgi:hypothetical protein
MKLLGDFFKYIENLISRGDGYYDKIIKISHIINFIYIITFSVFGIHILKNQILYNFNSTIQLLVCVLLIFKFHPFREHILKQSDSALIFSSAIFLLFNLSIIEVLNRYTSKVGIDIIKHRELTHLSAEVAIDAEEE